MQTQVTDQEIVQNAQKIMQICQRKQAAAGG